MASPSATGRRPGFPGCPYQGLLPYTQENAQVFYGRERLTAELMQKVAGHLTRGGPIIVTGASGAGKSSLVRAGLMPMLRKGVQLPGSDRWPQPVVITPTRDPLTEVAAHVAIRIGRSTGDVREELARQPDQAHLAVWQVLLKDDLQRENVAIPGVPGSAQAPGGGTARLVVVVDQFEQLFTLESSPEDRQAFITALHAMSSNPVGPDGRPPALVVIVARGDYIGQCAAYPELARVLDSAQFIVGPMNDSERRLAITGPADTAGLTIEPGLIETVISDLHAIGRGAAGELPLLSQAMLLTWQQREGDRLTSRGYGLFGGISTAVQASAEQAYGALEPEGKAIAQQALCAMVVLDRDGRASRRPLRRKEVYGRVTGSPEMIDAVLERFVAKRLIVLGEDATEISHDSLLREWPRLSEWLERDRDTWILHGQLADAAAKWEEKQDSSYLYRGVQLAVALSEAKTWRTDPARYPVATTGQERFLADSERDATRAERRRRRRTRILATVTALAVLAAVGLAAATTYAFRQRTAANGARDQAVLNQTSAEAQAIAATDTPLAADLNVAGYRMALGNSLMSDSIAERLISTENAPLPVSLDGGTGAVYGLGLSQDGHLLVTAGVNDAIRLWDVSGPGHALLESSIKPAFSRLDSAVLSKDGRLLAVGSTGAAGFALYNLSDPARPAFLGTFATDIVVAGLALSPNGRLLAVGDTTGAVHLWNVADPAHPAQAGVPGTGSEIGGTRLGLVRALAFSPTARNWPAAGKTAPSGCGASPMPPAPGC